MRRCLDCPAILLNIAEQVYEGGYDTDCRVAVAALGSTCRAFREVAEKVLWSRLFSLRPLIRTMPEDVWHEDGSSCMVSGTIVSAPCLITPLNVFQLMRIDFTSASRPKRLGQVHTARDVGDVLQAVRTRARP